MSTDMSQAAREELAPQGRLRAGLNLANFLLITRTPSGPRGIVPDLAAEIARRAGAALEFVGYDSPGQVADAAASDAWDIAFIGAEPARAAEIAFSAAYLEIEATYLVPANSPIRTIEEVDRPGVRIATSARSAYDLYLTRTLKHATLERAQGLDASFGLFVSSKLDVLSGLRPRLMEEVAKLPGARVLEGRFTAVQQAIGAPKARQAAAQYLRAFAEEVKASGFVAELIARHGVRGVNVAAAAT
jgi:polar amino acid transport system substrate-binding protein